MPSCTTETLPGLCRVEVPWLEESLSTAAEMIPLLDRVVVAMEVETYPERTCLEFRLVLEEAIMNGLKHGNGGDPTKQVLVRWCVGRQAVLAEVEDEGPGFDPEAVPDATAAENLEKASGRGVFLIRHYTSWLRYHGRGNRLTVCKHRQGS